MSQPLPAEPSGTPSDGSATSGPISPDADRQARIEELLVAGLDRYFAGQYEAAITIWTRVAFLERGHDRARAYIERARGAQAERHREAEEWLHDGIAAYQAGRMESARDLLTRAVDAAGPSDMALTFLQRLNRVNAAAPERHAQVIDRRVSGAAASRPTQWLATGAVSLLVASVIVLAGLPAVSWLGEPAVTPVPVESPRLEPVPVARESDLLLARARALRDAGRVRDALALVERVDAVDVNYGAAQRLRGDLQRTLLAAVDAALDEEAR